MFSLAASLAQVRCCFNRSPLRPTPWVPWQRMRSVSASSGGPERSDQFARCREGGEMLHKTNAMAC